MKRLFIFLCIVAFMGCVFAMMGCTTEEGLNNRIQVLKEQRDTLSSEVRTLESTKNNLVTSIVELKQDESVLKAYANGETVLYLVKFKLKQSHVSLNIGKHIKDAANAVEFEWPVSKTFYEKVSVGDNVLEEFRGGSFLVEGSIGSWNITVLGKRTSTFSDEDSM